MTRDEFIAAYKPREGDTIHECCCGSYDCPGWKIVNLAEQRRLMDAMDRLPEIVAKAAYDYGHQLAMEREQACIEALLRGTP